MDKIIKMKMTSVNLQNGNGMIRSRNGSAIPVRLSDNALFKGIDEGDIAIIRIINDEYIVTDFERPQKEVIEETNYDEPWLEGY